VPLAAFAGAVLTVILVSRLARSGGYLSLYNLLLSGIAVGAFFTALVSLLMYFSRRHLHQVVFGSWAGSARPIGPMFGWLCLTLCWDLRLPLIQARALNALLLGEEAAASLGGGSGTNEEMVVAGSIFAHSHSRGRERPHRFCRP